MESHAAARTRAAVRRRLELGGVVGNEILTMTIAAFLVVLLAAEFLTLLDLRGLLSVHISSGSS